MQLAKAGRPRCRHINPSQHRQTTAETNPTNPCENFAWNIPAAFLAGGHRRQSNSTNVAENNARNVFMTDSKKLELRGRNQLNSLWIAKESWRDPTHLHRPIRKRSSNKRKRFAL